MGINIRIAVLLAVVLVLLFTMTFLLRGTSERDYWQIMAVFVPVYIASSFVALYKRRVKK